MILSFPNPIKPGASKVAIFQDDIFPVGQPVVVRITHKLSSENRAAVQFRYFPSADAYSSRVGDDWPGGLNPSNALPAFFDRTRGNIPVDMNFWRALRAWSFGFLVQPAKQSRSRFTQSLKPLSCLALHGPNHGASDVGKIRIAFGEIQNVER